MLSWLMVATEGQRASHELQEIEHIGAEWHSLSDADVATAACLYGFYFPLWTSTFLWAMLQLVPPYFSGVPSLRPLFTLYLWRKFCRDFRKCSEPGLRPVRKENESRWHGWVAGEAKREVKARRKRGRGIVDTAEVTLCCWERDLAHEVIRKGELVSGIPGILLAKESLYKIGERYYSEDVPPKIHTFEL